MYEVVKAFYMSSPPEGVGRRPYEVGERLQCGEEAGKLLEKHGYVRPIAAKEPKSKKAKPKAKPKD